MQALPYVLPSQPHTGRKKKGHASGRFSHEPGPSHFPVVLWQNFFGLPQSASLLHRAPNAFTGPEPGPGPALAAGSGGAAAYAAVAAKVSSSIGTRSFRQRFDIRTSL